MSAVVTIVGRPNVGKSTLFNKLVGKAMALVHDRPGVTRDRREGEARLGDLDFTVVDTAGFEEDEVRFEGRMQRQTEAAAASADVCLFVIDARAGVTPLDAAFAKLLHRIGARVLLVANKCEGRNLEAALAEAYALGFGEPIAISAEHAQGLDVLYEALRDAFQALVDRTDDDDDSAGGEVPLRLAVVGRPNVGKSSLINRLLGQDRLITGPEAGITRDAIGVSWQWKGRRVKLFDTAGLRRKARISDAVELLSTADAIRAIRFAEVVILLIDVTQPLEKQDLTIADLVIREGRALVVAANKWDLISERAPTRKALAELLEERLPQIRGVPLVFLSALTGAGVERLMPAVATAHERWNQRIATAALNRWLDAVQARHPPPLVRGRRVKLRYATQVSNRPPSFVIFTTRPTALPESYMRYLTNSLRTDFGLLGVPIRITLRKGDNPYAS